MTNQNTNYSIRFNKTFSIATVSKEFKEKMYVFGSEAFNLAREIRNTYPNITFRVGSNHVQRTKKITYVAMKEHLKAKITVAQNDEEKAKFEAALIKFDSIKALSQIEHNPYRYVLTWFKSVCPELFSKEDATIEDSAETAQQDMNTQESAIVKLSA